MKAGMDSLEAQSDQGGIRRWIPPSIVRKTLCVEIINSAANTKSFSMVSSGSQRNGMTTNSRKPMYTV